MNTGSAENSARGANRKEYSSIPSDGSAFRTPETVESEFDIFFARENLQRVSDLVGHSPSFANADYISRAFRVAVELKVLDKDYFAEGGIIDRLCAIVPAPVNVNEDGTGVYTVSFPPPNREGRNDTFEEPMRRILKKANRQLRETIDNVLEGNGTGFLVLAMNRFRSLHMEAVQQLVDELLKDEFSSISGYMLCTPGWGLLISNQDVGVIGYTWCREDLRPELQQAWWELGANWCEFAESGGHGRVTMNKILPGPRKSGPVEGGAPS